MSIFTPLKCSSTLPREEKRREEKRREEKRREEKRKEEKRREEKRREEKRKIFDVKKQNAPCHQCFLVTQGGFNLNKIIDLQKL